MRIAVGSDHRGVEMRMKLVELLGRLGQEVLDVGSHGPEPFDYPDIAETVGHKVSARRGRCRPRHSLSAVPGSACASPRTRFPAFVPLPATTTSRPNLAAATTT